MRILHLLNDIQHLGNGIINAAVDLACLQAKAGHSVAIASLGGDYEPLLAQYGVQHFQFDQQRKLSNLLKSAKCYRQIVRSFQPDIVHAHMMTGVVLAKVLRIGMNYSLVSTVHNEFRQDAILMGLADRVIAVSQAVAESMARRGISPHKLRVVCNGTLGSPRDRFFAHHGESPPLALRKPAIATVAGMYQRKGIAELIAAFAQIAPQFPDAQLYLIGDGPDRAQFEAQAQQTFVADRIHFEGFQAQPLWYLQAIDIFVLASHQEPFGLAITEARAAGCAIVASHIGGIPEALDGGDAGILIPPLDENALATAISQLLGDRDWLNTWKLRAQQNLAWTHVSRVNEETLAVYQELENSHIPTSNTQSWRQLARFNSII